MAFGNDCSLLIVTVALTQFGRNASCKFWGLGPLFLENRCLQGVDDGNVGQGTDKFLQTVNSKHTATEAVWAQSAMHVYEVQS